MYICVSYTYPAWYQMREQNPKQILLGLLLLDNQILKLKKSIVYLLQAVSLLSWLHRDIVTYFRR